MKILNTKDVVEILENSPDTEFSLQPVKVQIHGTGDAMFAGYHIYEGQLPKMIHVNGKTIWEYVPHPGK